MDAGGIFPEVGWPVIFVFTIYHTQTLETCILELKLKLV